MRQKHFNRVRQQIKDSLFLAKPTFCGHLMEVAAAVDELRATPFVAANSQHLYTLQEYAELQASEGPGQRARAVRSLHDCVAPTRPRAQPHHLRTTRAVGLPPPPPRVCGAGGCGVL